MKIIKQIYTKIDGVETYHSVADAQTLYTRDLDEAYRWDNRSRLIEEIRVNNLLSQIEKARKEGVR